MVLSRYRFCYRIFEFMMSLHFCVYPDCIGIICLFMCCNTRVTCGSGNFYPVLIASPRLSKIGTELFDKSQIDIAIRVSVVSVWNFRVQPADRVCDIMFTTRPPSTRLSLSQHRSCNDTSTSLRASASLRCLRQCSGVRCHARAVKRGCNSPC